MHRRKHDQCFFLNLFFRVTQKKESHIALEPHEGKYILAFLFLLELITNKMIATNRTEQNVFYFQSANKAIYKAKAKLFSAVREVRWGDKWGRIYLVALTLTQDFLAEWPHHARCYGSPPDLPSKFGDQSAHHQRADQASNRKHRNGEWIHERQGLLV